MAILLQVKELSKEYAGKKIFSGLSFSVSEKQKIGVIGRNGAGKSTLFKIINGEEQQDDGEIIIHQSASIGYLKQHDDWQETETALAYLIRTSNKPEWRARQLASKFELGSEKLAMPAGSLSGGWRMRLKLSAMLLLEPNLFLLDEPSNYLDLNTILLLENYLRSYRGSYLIISHDREFLKRTCQETIEISKNGCYHYPGNIENYLAFKEQKLAAMIKANDSLERQQEHWQEFVDRFRFKSSKAKQAQALIRKISKLEEKRITIEHEAGLTRINIPQTQKKSNFALKMNNLYIGYEGKAVVDDIDFDIRSGEKIAILGLNGQGKSTLIRTLFNKLPPLSGTFRFAANSKIACHSQDELEAMDGQEQAGVLLRRTASADTKTEAVLKMAGDFLFREDDLKKTIAVLSGGEKSRLLMASILLGKPDILLLDEVTCHLDFETAEALGRALQKFNGTVIFASHDRTFSSLIATGLVEIKGGTAKRKHEDYEEYVSKLEKKLWKKQMADNISDSEDKEKEKKRYLANKERQKKIQSLEKDLTKMHTARQELLQYFLEHYSEYLPKKNQELEELERNIADKEEYWLRLQEEADKEQKNNQ